MSHPIPNDALDADLAILAQKGAGKTYTAKGIVEWLLSQGARVLVVDPLSVWWGLKAGAEGEGEGYPVAVFGGPHGDMPLSEAMAEPLARTLSHANLPAVLDVAFMKKAEQMRFCAKLFETLFAENRDPLTLVLEEAHVFAPQSMGGGDAHCFHQVDRIARMGRAFGFRLITITQRPARLHKDILTQAAGLIALRMQHPLDQKPILDWFTANGDKAFAKHVESDLANLPVGEAFVGIPDQKMFERVKFPRILTFDSSATPKRGEKRIQPQTLAQVDLSEIRAALEAPGEEKPAATGQTLPAAKADLQAEYDRGYTDGKAEGKKLGIAEGVRKGLSQARGAIQAIENGWKVPGVFLDTLPDKPDMSTDVPAPPMKKPNPTRRNPPLSKPKAPGENPLVSAARTIWPVKLTWAGLCATQGRKARGGHFNTQRKVALESGLVREEGGLVVLADPPDASGADPIELLKQNLPGGSRDLFGAIVAQPGLPITDYAEILGRKASGGHWNTSVSILRQNGLIDESNGTRPSPLLRGDQ